MDFLVGAPPISRFGVGLGILVIGALLLREGHRWLRLSVDQRRGRSLLARIVRTRLSDRASVDDSGAYGRSWYVDVEYEYQIGRDRRSPKRIATTQFRHSGWWRAMLQARRFADGTEVRIYLDPDEPTRATLDPGLVIKRPWVFLVGGVTCTAVGLLYLVGYAVGLI